jgi:hypothetical protein
MRVSVVVCEECNAPATDDMVWIQIGEEERLVCSCGSQAFMLLEMNDELIPEGSLIVQKEERKERRT